MVRFVMVGHVDSGKSTLCGQILLQVGHIQEREFEKVQQQASGDGMTKWAYARLVDTFEEEQARGKTHEYNIIEFNYNNRSYSLIDTPGHSSYVRSMIAGVSTGADVVIIIVSMHEKEWNAGFNGMLPEHIKLAKGLGVKDAVIVANKMDLIDWNKKICMERLREVKRYCNEAGFEDSHIKAIPISAWNGVGIVNVEGLPEWYKGPCLMDLVSGVNEDSCDVVSETTCEILVEFKSDFDGIITVGFTGIAYIGNKETPFEVIASKNKIIRTGDVGLMRILLNDAVAIGSGTIILRTTYNTIGVGNIKKCKTESSRR